MTPVSPLSFFLIVLRPTRTFVAMATIVLGTAGWMARADPGDIEQVASLALLCQMFAAATGYRERARQGHFDPVLVAGASRPRVVAAHWTLSVLPGIAVWVLLAVVECWSRPAAWPVSLTASGLAALLWVSTVAWAVALPLTRYASGILWLVALFTLVAAQWTEKLREPFQTMGHRWTDELALAGAALLNPFLLLTAPEATAPASLAVIACAAGAAAMLAGWFAATLDNTLEDPS